VLVPLLLFAAGKMGDLRVGPFPAGTPVNLVASLNPDAPTLQVIAALWQTRGVLSRIERERLSEDAARQLFDREAAPDLLALTKNPDWVEDRGHYFASSLSDEDKRALIEFLKTF